MTISHPHILNPDSDEAVVFAELGGFTCSVCAPSSWDVAQVIAFAEKQSPSATRGKGYGCWVSIDKGALGFGSPTPNPCNQYPEKRLHYFMMRDET